MDRLSPVPPVVALLLERVKFGCDEWSDDDIEHVQSAILDRVLGRNGEVATNDIETVFEGLMDPDVVPALDQPCEWVESSTGATAKFPLQHAVDFAYFVDGGRRPVPENVGPSFCRVPTGHAHQDGIHGIPEPEDVLELFDPFLDDDTSPQDAEVTVPTPSVPQPGSKRPRAVSQHEEEKEEEMQLAQQQRRRVSSRSALDKDAMIIDKLGDDPDLLERFLDIRRREVQNGIAPSRPMVQAVVVAREPSTCRGKTEQTSKYSFTPQPDQQYVHDQVTSEKHRGKTPYAYISGLVRSDAVKFKALPGICTRAFDIRFGSKGLSIRHFARLSPEDRVAWLQAGGSNFDNLSATAEFEKAAPAGCIEDVVDSIRVFLTYAREYCCGELIGLAEAILRFIEETLMRVSWDDTELPSVVYWVNDVLENFREAVASDSDVTQVQLRCSTEDRLLRDLMFVKLHRQVDALKQSKSVVAASVAEGKRPATREIQPDNLHGVRVIPGCVVDSQVSECSLHTDDLSTSLTCTKSNERSRNIVSRTVETAKLPGNTVVGRDNYIPSTLDQPERQLTTNKDVQRVSPELAESGVEFSTAGDAQATGHAGCGRPRFVRSIVNKDVHRGNARAFLHQHSPGSMPEAVLDASYAGRCTSGTYHSDGGNFAGLSRISALKIQQALEKELLLEECRISVSRRKRGFKRSSNESGSDYSIDKIACKSLSEIIRRNTMSVEEATEFWRGENPRDCRPNKALDPERLQQVLKGYPHLDLLVQIAKTGVDVRWRDGPVPKRPPPKNHGSCQRYLRAVTKSLCDGQDSGQYMIVNADILEKWPNVVCSPLGAVEKKGTNPEEEVRTIHDLSFPKGGSVNDAFVVDSVPKVRHLRTQSNQVFRMVAYVPELGILIIDMAAPFGWSGSPPCYALFGRAISWLLGNNSPATVSASLDRELFFSYEWVDDHILVEPDVDDRLPLAEATLRHAMLAVLGPRSINEAKFSDWSSELVALELSWNTVRRTVSIPQDKITKARDRVIAMAKCGTSTKSEFYKLLGSLRHVSNCLRTAKPFYQRLQSQCTAAPRFGRIALSDGAKSDLIWFQQILDHGCLAELPLSMFGDLPAPQVELYMDASNIGLAVLDPACDSFLQIKFDAEETELFDQVVAGRAEFSINVREHLSMAIALWTWGGKWHRQASGQAIHVRCWTDNVSAASWCNKLHAHNMFSQEINRAIGLAEAYFSLRISAEHLPGLTNWMADAASRAWAEPELTRWTNFSSCWSQTQVPSGCRKLLHQLFESFQSKSLATSSSKQYSSTWSQWSKWCEWLQFSTWLPEEPKKHSYQLALFATYCWRYGWGNTRSGYSVSTVLSKISHISWHHRRLLGYGVGLLPGHQLAITGMQRSDPPSNPISPITPEILRHLHKYLDFEDTQHRVIWGGGATVLGFFFLLRRSEYLAQGSTVQKYAIHRSDVKFIDQSGREATLLQNVTAVVIQFRGSKSDQFGVGASRTMARSGCKWCCPVLAAWFLSSHHQALGIGPNTLLCKVDAMHNLQVRDVVKAIKCAAKLAERYPLNYGSHSLRSGGATALCNAGFDSLAVKLFGRWWSDAVEKYTRISGQLTSQMAPAMIPKTTLQQFQWATPTPHPGRGGATM